MFPSHLTQLNWSKNREQHLKLVNLVFFLYGHDTNILFQPDCEHYFHTRLVLVKFYRHIVSCSKQTRKAASQFPFNISVALLGFEKNRHP